MLHEYRKRIFLLLYLYFLLSRKVVCTLLPRFVDNHLTFAQSLRITLEQVMQKIHAVLSSRTHLFREVSVQCHAETKVIIFHTPFIKSGRQEELTACRHLLTTVQAGKGAAVPAVAVLAAAVGTEPEPAGPAADTEAVEHTAIAASGHDRRCMRESR